MADEISFDSWGSRGLWFQINTWLKVFQILFLDKIAILEIHISLLSSLKKSMK